MAVKCAVDEGPGCLQHLYFTNNTDREIIVVETMPLKGKYADEFLSIEEYRLIKNGWRRCFRILPYRTEMVVDMYGGFGFLRSLLKEYDFCFTSSMQKSLMNIPQKSWLTVGAVLDKRLYMLPHRRYSRASTSRSRCCARASGATSTVCSHSTAPTNNDTGKAAWYTCFP